MPDRGSAAVDALQIQKQKHGKWHQYAAGGGGGSALGNNAATGEQLPPVRLGIGASGAANEEVLPKLMRQDAGSQTADVAAGEQERGPGA